MNGIRTSEYETWSIPIHSYTIVGFHYYRVKMSRFNANFIEIQNANLDDNGIYECVAKNAVATSIIPFTLNVFGE